MTVINIAEITGGSVLLAFFSLVFLRHRKTSDLFHRYWEAMQAENNGDEEKAIHLYGDALNRSRKIMRGDKKLRGDIEQRLKTLLISSDFEKSFQRTELAGSPVNSPKTRY
jgi:hypothetical protein